MSGLLHPKNVAPPMENSSGFKEGFVRVDTSAFRVVPPFVPKPDPSKPNAPAPEPERGPFTALTWSVTRLDENLEPITDEQENPKTETIDWSLGGKSLAKIHPGQADSLEDTDIEDLGVAPNTEGNTVFIVDSTFKINANSGIAHLYESLLGKVPEEMLDREWAPDWAGAVMFIKTRPSEDKLKGRDGVERPYNIKYVDKVVSLGKKGAKGKVSAAGKASEGPEVQIAKDILTEIAGDNAGQTLTFKTLNLKVAGLLKKNKVDAKLHVPTMTIVKDEGWLASNGHHFNMDVDGSAQTVTFGE